MSASLFGDDEDDEDDNPLDEELSGDTATIHIEGPLSMSGPSPLARLFGIDGTSYKNITAWFKNCKGRADVKNVVLAFNSPGGDVNGVDEAWQAIQACGKNCTAENHGIMASAAYWLASACPNIVAMSPACEQGSIGVKHVVIDDSEAMKAGGKKVITIVNKDSPYKDDDASGKTGREALQKRCDAMAEVFMARVAEGRKTTIDDVRENYGRGAVMISFEAKRVGMIDDIQMNADAPAVPDNFSRNPAAGVLAAQHTPAAPAPTGRKPMTFEEFIASDPAAKAKLDGMLTAAKAEGRAEAQAVAKKVAQERYQLNITSLSSGAIRMNFQFNNPVLYSSSVHVLFAVSPDTI